MFTMRDDYAEWVYRFRVENPITRDARVLVCIRERLVEDEWETQVLTTEGWHTFSGYEEWPSNLPEMSGIALHHERGAVRQLIDGVKMALKEAGAEEIHAAQAST